MKVFIIVKTLPVPQLASLICTTQSSLKWLSSERT